MNDLIEAYRKKIYGGAMDMYRYQRDKQLRGSLAAVLESMTA